MSERGGGRGAVSVSVTVAVAVQFAVCASAMAGMSGKDIMVKNEDARSVDDMNSNATLTTGGGGGTERVKQFTWWRKLTADKVHYNTLTRFREPAEVRGEGILFLEHPDGENDVMMYLPSFKKIRRVESQAQSGSFMGSEFSYSDIASVHVDDYSFKVLKEEVCPTAEAAAVKCHVVESTPANDKVKERNGYSRSVTWVRQDNFMGVQSEYYDGEGKLFKRMEADQIKVIDAARGKWLAHLVRMVNLKTNRFTLLVFAGVKANAGVTDSTFTQQNLSRDK